MFCSSKKNDESIKSGLRNAKSKQVSAPVNRSQPVECPIRVKQDAGCRMLAGDWSLKTAWIHWWSGSTAWPLIKSFNRVKLIRCVPVSYTHLRAHETRHDLVCRL